MTSQIGMQPRLDKKGRERPGPRRFHPRMICTAASGREATCGNKKGVRVASVSRSIIDHIVGIAELSDAAILAALQIQRSESGIRALERERKQLQDAIVETDRMRRVIQRMVASGAQSQADAERDLFEHQREKAQAEERIQQIDSELSRQHAKPDFERVRSTLLWLAERWAEMTVREKAEALRLLVRSVTYVPNGTPFPSVINILEYGPAFLEAVPEIAATRRRRA